MLKGPVVVLLLLRFEGITARIGANFKNIKMPPGVATYMANASIPFGPTANWTLKLKDMELDDDEHGFIMDHLPLAIKPKHSWTFENWLADQHVNVHRSAKVVKDDEEGRAAYATFHLEHEEKHLLALQKHDPFELCAFAAAATA